MQIVHDQGRPSRGADLAPSGGRGGLLANAAAVLTIGSFVLIGERGGERARLFQVDWPSRSGEAALQSADGQMYSVGGDGWVLMPGSLEGQWLHPIDDGELLRPVLIPDHPRDHIPVIVVR